MKPGAPGGPVKPAQSTGVGTQIRSANQTNAQIKANIQISQSQIITQANTGWSLLKATLMTYVLNSVLPIATVQFTSIHQQSCHTHHFAENTFSF